MNKLYESPALELIEVGVECGFAASGGDGDSGSGGNTGPIDGEWVDILMPPGQD